MYKEILAGSAKAEHSKSFLRFKKENPPAFAGGSLFSKTKLGAYFFLLPAFFLVAFFLAGTLFTSFQSLG
jgi:hypothetical protein